MRVILLHNRHKEVVGESFVDDDDYERLVDGPSWYRSSKGYVVSNVYREDGRRTVVRMHRVILGLTVADRFDIDHVNRNKADNRKENLRRASRAQNNENRDRDKFPGVTANHKRWAARGNRNNKTVYLGTFDTQEEAAEVARVWRRTHMPFSTDDAS